MIATYATGERDVALVAEDIRRFGGHCEVIAYDVREDADRQSQGLAGASDTLLHFATPPIMRRKAQIFARDRFEEFNAFYLDGFERLVEASLRLRPAGIAAFYPSTIAVQDRWAKMTEYAMSKAAGEILCADISRYRRGVRILTHRIPRVSTDQTASLVPVETSDALSIMLPIVRQMHSTGEPGK